MWKGLTVSQTLCLDRSYSPSTKWLFGIWFWTQKAPTLPPPDQCSKCVGITLREHQTGGQVCEPTTWWWMATAVTVVCCGCCNDLFFIASNIRKQHSDKIFFSSYEEKIFLMKATQHKISATPWLESNEKEIVWWNLKYQRNFLVEPFLCVCFGFCVGYWKRFKGFRFWNFL